MNNYQHLELENERPFTLKLLTVVNCILICGLGVLYCVSLIEKIFHFIEK